MLRPYYSRRRRGYQSNVSRLTVAHFPQTGFLRSDATARLVANARGLRRQARTSR